MLIILKHLKMRKLIISLSVIMLSNVISFADDSTVTDTIRIVQGRQYTLLPVKKDVKVWSSEDSTVAPIIQFNAGNKQVVIITGKKKGESKIFGLGKANNETVVEHLVTVYETVASYLDNEKLSHTKKSYIDSILNPDKSKQNDVSDYFTMENILLYTLTIIIICLLVYIILDKKKRRNEILYTLTGRKKSSYGVSRVTQWENEIIEKVLSAIKQNHSSDNTQKSHDNELERVGVLEPIPNPILKPTPQENEQLHYNQPKTLYADAIIRDFFNKVSEQPNDDTVYELLLKTPNATTTEFTIFQNAYPRVIDTPDFIKGCEKQGHSKTSLEVEKGVATLQDNGKWQITQPAKVKFV
jgi:hypothetical protein